MIASGNKTNIASALLLVMVVCGALAVWLDGPVFPMGLCGYLVIALVPGAAIYRLTAKDPEFLEGLTMSVAVSPVPVTAVAVVLMLIGVPVKVTATVLLVLVGVLGVLAIQRGPSRWHVSLAGKQQRLVLAGLFLLVSAAISYLPLTREWWLTRSDAWFHAAVVAQITDFGIPPKDPYFVGHPLQYMWFYHVYVVVLSKVSGIAAIILMPLINVHAVIGLALAAFLCASIFRKSFSHRIASTITVLFGMNAAFWAFLPVKLLRAFFGEVRGMADVSRILSLEPFDYHTVRRFVAVGFNQEFMMDKFMVATAFSTGLCLMAVAWWASTRYVASEKKEHLVAAFLAAFGVVVFHTAIGVGVFGGIAGGAFLLIILKRYLSGCATRSATRLLLALILCGILLTPYVYSVTYAKTQGEAIPIGLSATKMIGLFVSCALVLFLSAFQVTRLLRDRDIKTYFMLYTTASLFFICTILQLPASNSYDKLPFLIFFPLAIVGGWTLADFADRAASNRRRIGRFVLVCLLAFGPLNILMFAGYYNSPAERVLSKYELDIAEWVRAATPRDAIMIDTQQGGFLLVTGPRRYYLAAESYADIWGYDPKEIERRKRVKQDLYSPGPLESTTLEILGSMPYPMYVIVRTLDNGVDPKVFEQRPELFHRAFTSGPIYVYEIDRDACRLAGQASGPTVE